jgi:DNA-binding SARP family transcriptional activator
LAFLLWPASIESQARTNLRQLLHHLKRALPAEGNWLETTHFAVRWRQDAPCSIDVVDFQAAVADAAFARTENNRAREIRSLTTAAEVYEDDLLPGIYDDWLTPLREEYRKRISEVLQRLATARQPERGIRAAIPAPSGFIAPIIR